MTAKRRIPLKFAALARKAFDVMLRRKITKRCECCDLGWDIYCDPVDGQWWVAVREESATPSPQGWVPSWKSIKYISASDPFTALVEADAWYKKEIEKRPQQDSAGSAEGD